jgi:hypothetical protein
MWCPRCKTEFGDDVSVCPNCGGELVASPPPGVADEGAGGDDVVTILETSDPAVLAVLQSLLEAEGIYCQIQGEGPGEALGLGPLPGATGPMRLQVSRRDEEAARGLMAAREGSFETPPAGD